MSGVGAALKANNPKVKIVAVEPEDSPVLSGGKPGPIKYKVSVPDLCQRTITVP